MPDSGTPWWHIGLGGVNADIARMHRIHCESPQARSLFLRITGGIIESSPPPVRSVDDRPVVQAHRMEAAVTDIRSEPLVAALLDTADADPNVRGIVLTGSAGRDLRGRGSDVDIYL